MNDEFVGRRKHQFLEKALEGDHVFIHLFAGEEGVELPQQLRGQETVSLKLSRRFQGELTLGEEYITAVLRFSEGYFSCCVPYGAIWGCTTESGEMQLWADNQEKIKSLMDQMVSTVSSEDDSPPADESGKKKPKSRTARDKKKSGKSSSHLTRVK